MRTRAARLSWTVTLGALALSFAPIVSATESFPYHVIRRIAFSGTQRVQALVTGSSGREIYAARGHSVWAYTVTGARRATHHAFHGTISALVVGGNGELITVTRNPARVEFLAPQSLRVLRRRALESAAPTALLYDSRAHMLFLESHSAHRVARLSPISGRALATVTLQGALGQMAANGRGTLYVVNTTHDALDVVDARNMRYKGAIPLKRCDAPSGLAMDPIGRRLFVACGNGRALIVDADLGFTFVRLPIQAGARLRVRFAFHPLGSPRWKGGAFIVGSGAISAIQMRAFVRYRAGGQFSLDRCCTAVTLDPRAGQLWLGLAPAGTHPAALWVLDASAAEAP